MDLLGLPARPQDQVIILAAIVIRIEAADAFRQFFLEYKEMADVVLREQQIRSPIRLEERFKPPPERVDLVFVAIDQIGIRNFVDRFANVRESVRR